MKILGLVGHAGSGKNTFAEEFHYHNYREFAFADPLKAACAELFGIPISSFHSRTLKEIPDPYWKVSPREIAQFVGTELVREHMGKLLTEFGKDFWIHAIKYKLFQQDQEASATGKEFKAVITDCRFENEVNFILSIGGHICYLTRPEFDGTVGISNHPSEKLAAEFTSHYPESTQVHYIENSGSKEDLKIKAHALAVHLESHYNFAVTSI